MSPFRFPSRLATVALLAGVAGVLSWLLLGFADNREGRIVLPAILTAGGEPAGGAGAGALSTVEQLLVRDRTLTRERVERLPPEKWRKQAGPGFFQSETGEVAWFRVTLRNPGGRAWHGVLADRDFFLDRVDAWIQQDPGPTGDTWRHLQSGETVAPAEKAMVGREPAFPVDLPARGERVIYLRVADRETCYIGLAWWPDQAVFQGARARSALAEGIYLGGLCALFCYNLVLWLRLRLRDIGYYSLYLGSLVGFIVLARGHLAEVEWRPVSPRLEQLIVLVMALSGFSLTSLARVFLEVKAQAAWAHWLTRGLQAMMVLLAAGVVTKTGAGDAIRWLGLAVPAVALTHVTLLGLAIWAWRRGVRQARFFLWAFGCLFAGTGSTAAAWIWDNSLKDMAMQGLMVGSALEMLLLSLATADRFVRAQNQLVEETEQRRVIQEAYADELAAEVRERTQELERANADKDRMLTVIGHDLRSPLTGLMRSADRPTEEFARETARTGRELLLMIEDLVLWAQMRAGTVVIADHPASALLIPAMALHGSLASHRGTELILEVPDGLWVKTDLVLAQTLVRNLLANALKFAHRRVVLRAVDDGQGSVSFTVTNDGPSLPPEIMARLAADQDGPMTAMGGLGLRLCREICVALGMRLRARTPAEGGVQFSFAMKSAARLGVGIGGGGAQS